MQELEEQDKRIVCVDCDDVFIFTAGEQIYYEKRELEEPKRCGSCRTKKRERIARENKD